MSAAGIAVGALVLRVLIAAIFARASLHKWRDRSHFVAELRAYRLTPDALASPLAMSLAMIEAIVALTLLNPDWNLPALIAAGLFAVHGAAIAINLLRGRTEIRCGCGGPLAAQSTIDWSLVIRNATLAMVALLIAAAPVTPLLPTHWLIVLPASATALLLYEATEQAIANRQRVLAWKR